MAEIKPFFDAYETGNFLIKGNKNSFSVWVNPNGEIDYGQLNTYPNTNLENTSILNLSENDYNAINKAINKAINPNTAGGKRSTSKSRKTQLRDEHGRFLPSNKRKNGRQRRTARRPMSDKTENTMLMASLV